MITLELVGFEEKEILRNLLEKYLYEFSQYFDLPLNTYGLHGYKYLDNYWFEENRWPFFIKVDGNLAGFALVNDYPEAEVTTDFTLAEFFIIYRYRQAGIGTTAVNQLFDKFKGSWQLMYNPKNIISEKFWTKVVKAQDKDYQIISDSPAAIYEPDIQGKVLIFKA